VLELVRATMRKDETMPCLRQVLGVDKMPQIRLSAVVLTVVVGLLAGCTQPSPTPEVPTSAPQPVPTQAPAPSEPKPSPVTTAPVAEPSAGNVEVQGGTEPAPAVQPVGSATAGKRVFKIDPFDEGSAILWAGSNPTGTRHGGFVQFEGTFEVGGDNIESGTIGVTVKMGSVFSDAADLTAKMKGEEHFFNPIKFPVSTFKSTSIRKSGDRYEITGDLTIREKTNTITFPAEIAINGNTAKGKAEFELNRQDFGITYQSNILDWTINDMAKVTIELVAKEAR
jgi:polyisoprenoid-binding protein YceI